jgi:hypothetical protein
VDLALVLQESPDESFALEQCVRQTMGLEAQIESARGASLKTAIALGTALTLAVLMSKELKPLKIHTQTGGSAPTEAAQREAKSW